MNSMHNRIQGKSASNFETPTFLVQTTTKNKNIVVFCSKHQGFIYTNFFPFEETEITKMSVIV